MDESQNLPVESTCPLGELISTQLDFDGFLRASLQRRAGDTRGGLTDQRRNEVEQLLLGGGVLAGVESRSSHHRPADPLEEGLVQLDQAALLSDDRASTPSNPAAHIHRCCRDTVQT